MRIGAGKWQWRLDLEEGWSEEGVYLDLEGGEDVDEAVSSVEKYVSI